MLWKLLLTAAVLYIAYRVLRARSPGFARPDGSDPFKGLHLPRGTMRAVAFAVVGLMIAGTALYVFEDWRSGQRVMEVQVVNANTGTITPYRARRRDIEGRGFRTLEGQTIRLADVERMILTEADSAP